MNRISAGIFAIVGLGACGASTVALADDPAGFYLGAGIGESNLRNDGYGYNDYYGYDNHQTAWKLIAGIRPIPPVGAEFEYIDFGSGERQRELFYGGNFFNGTTATPRPARCSASAICRWACRSSTSSARRASRACSKRDLLHYPCQASGDLRRYRRLLQ
jgi:hypothetical protein